MKHTRDPTSFFICTNDQHLFTLLYFASTTSYSSLFLMNLSLPFALILILGAANVACVSEVFQDTPEPEQPFLAPLPTAPEMPRASTFLDKCRPYIAASVLSLCAITQYYLRSKFHGLEILEKNWFQQSNFALLVAFMFSFSQLSFNFNSSGFLRTAYFLLVVLVLPISVAQLLLASSVIPPPTVHV